MGKVNTLKNNHNLFFFFPFRDIFRENEESLSRPAMFGT